MYRQRQSGRGRGQGRIGGKGRLITQKNMGQNRQQGVKNIGNKRQFRGGNGNTRGTKQFVQGRNKSFAGSIASRLGVKKSPIQKLQQKRQALRKGANNASGSVKRILGNRQTGFTTIGNTSAVAGKGKNNTVFDARQKLERKLKITDARQKILSKYKSKGSGGQGTGQGILAKRALKGLMSANNKKKTGQSVQVQKNKTVVDAAIPKVVLKNPQAITFEDKETNLLTRTVKNTVAIQGGIPVKTVIMNTGNSGQQRPQGRTKNRGNRGRGGKNIVLTRTVNQSVGLRAALGLEGERPLTRSIPGNLHAHTEDTITLAHLEPQKGNALYFNRFLGSDMDDPSLMPAPLTTKSRAVSTSSMLITARNVEPVVNMVEYMEEDDDDPYGSGPLVLGRGIAQKQGTFIRIANDQYQQPQPVQPKVRILPPTKPKRPVPVLEPEEDEVVVSPLQGYKVLVTNLHPIVTQDDIIELFGSLGALKRARIVKKGQAEVVFVNKDDALNAVKKYHNRELDALPMQLKLVTPIPTKDLSTPVFRLPKSSTTADGQKEKIDLDMDIVHRALFKTGAKGPGAPKPVTFTVKI